MKSRQLIQEQVESLLRLDPADGTNDEIFAGESEIAANRRFTGPVASKERVIDAVQDD